METSQSQMTTWSSPRNGTSGFRNSHKETEPPFFYLLGNDPQVRHNFIHALKSSQEGLPQVSQGKDLAKSDEICRLVELKSNRSMACTKIAFVDKPFRSEFPITYPPRAIVYLLDKTEIANPQNILKEVGMSSISSSLDGSSSVRKIKIGKALEMMFEDRINKLGDRISKESLPTVFLTSCHQFEKAKDIQTWFTKFLVNKIYFRYYEIFDSKNITLNDIAELVKCSSQDPQGFKEKILSFLGIPSPSKDEDGINQTQLIESSANIPTNSNPIKQEAQQKLVDHKKCCKII